MNQPGSPAPRKRRVRYAGTHPRRFEDKYKELHPERYSQEVQKVLERGQTPAGTHRSVCVRDVLDHLAPRPGDTGLDATLGYGGHAQEILRRILPGGRLFGIDVDPLELPRTETRLRQRGYTEENLVVRRMNFAGAQRLLAEARDGFDFVLADLGVSSMQMDNPARGFSFKSDGPLDLRMNPGKGPPASALLASLDEQSIAAMLAEYADEPHAAAIARSIGRQARPVTTTRQLASIVEEAVRSTAHGLAAEEQRDAIRESQQRTFQALRIAVNDELGVLDLFLRQLPDLLKPGGRAVILSFHSGEDRRVKKSFLGGLRNGVYRQIAPDPVRPSPEERRDNPRCACAKLRWAVRAAGPGRCGRSV